MKFNQRILFPVLLALPFIHCATLPSLTTTSSSSSSTLPQVTSTSATTSTSTDSASITDSDDSDSDSKSTTTATTSTRTKAKGMPSLTTAIVVSFTAVVPDSSIDPYIFRSKHVNGTVFIAVGTIILSLFFALMGYKIWMYIKDRRSAGKFDENFDDHYGSAGVNYLDEKNFHGLDDNNSTFFYDANAYAKFKNQNGQAQGQGQGHSPSASLPGSHRSHRSNGSNSPKSSSSSGHGEGEKSSSSIYYGLNEDMNKLAPQQGRSLRTALNMNGGSSASLDILATTKKSRSSYISPINELINSSQQHLQFSQLAGLGGGSAPGSGSGGFSNNATNTSLNYVVNNHTHTGSSPSIPTFMISDNESNSSSPQLTNSSTSHLLTHTRQQSGSLGAVSEEYFDASNSQSGSSSDPRSSSLKKQQQQQYGYPHSHNPQGSSSLRLSTLGLGTTNSTTMQNRASRATSMNLLELAKMIEDSMKPGTGTGDSVPAAMAGSETGNGVDAGNGNTGLDVQKRSAVVRPPSMVLDKLMRDEEFDLDDHVHGTAHGHGK
ncbi:unnamed protein product [Ambrosiozyma monospora]|uniref:Unnamed protein product n=1 Tax=Ambrosiozyma monospora TaxID=43982 RepID=A0A9W6YZH2_AMBMO|nr:unnamed protein product [Ambrosiozyma monospora]